MRIESWRPRISSFLAFALFLGIFQSLSMFAADGVPATINKKIVVRDSSGNLYAGAQVQLVYDDQTGNGLVSQGFSSIVTTNSSGVADVTAPDAVNWLQLIVEPPASDLTQALFVKTLNLDDETLNVSLSASNFRIKIQKSDGTDAKAHAWVYTNKFPLQTLRTGPFGLAITPQDVAWGGYFGLSPAEDEDRNQTYIDYSVKNVTSGGSSAYKLFNSDGTQVTPDGSNVFAAKFNLANISGNLINADGSPYVLPEGVAATVHLWRLTSGGNRWYEQSQATMRPGDDSWSSKLWSNGENSKYELSVHFENSLTLGEVSAGYVWMNSAGSLSSTETGTYTTTLSKTLKVVPGTPTIGFMVKDSSGSLINSTYNLYDAAKGNNLFSGYAASKGNFTLPNGKYGLELYPAVGSKQVYSTYTILVGSSGITITDEFGTAATSSGNVFDLTLKPINLKFVMSDPTTSAALRISPDISLRQQVTNPKGTFWSNLYVPWIKLDSQTVGMSIPEGTFKLDINSSNSDIYGKKTYELIRTGNTITINGQAPTLANSTFKLPLNLANFKFKVVDPNDLTTPLSGAWIDVCNNDKTLAADGSDLCSSSGVDQDAMGAMYVGPGSYSVMVSGGENNTTKTYTATVNSSNVISITGETASAGRFTLHSTKPNLTGSLFNSDGTTPLVFSETQSALVELEYTDSNGNRGKSEGRWLNFWNTKFGFNLTNPGKYRISATPNGFPDYANTFSSYIYVNNSGQLSTNQASGYGAEITNFGVSLKPGNLPLTIKNPIDNQPLKNGWVYIYSQRGGYWQNFDLNSAIDGKVNANLEPNSDLVVQVEPYGNPALSYKIYTVQVDADGVPTVRDDSAVLSKTAGRYVLSSNRANISGQVAMPNGSALSGIDWLEVMLQRSEKVYDKTGTLGNYWYNYAGAPADADGNFGFSTHDAGTYRVSARPHGSVDVATGISDTFTISPESATTFTKDLGKIRLSTPSLKLKVKAPGSADYSTDYGISITQNGNWIENPYVNNSGISSISVSDPGAYELRLYPPEGSAKTLASKQYKLTVSSVGGVTTSTITGATGVSTSGDYTVLEFGSPNLKGQVRTPDSSTVMPYVQVVAVDATTYQEFEQYSSNADNLGAWAMSLEKGTYKIYARAPWGSINYTNSDYVGDVVVNETGTVTSMPAGTSATNLVIKLATPTWSGLIKSPDSSTVVPYAQICLSGYSTVYKGQFSWCTNANAQGQWALTMPSTVTLNSSSELTAYDWNQRLYSNLRIRGKTAIEALIGTGGTNKVINFPAPNIQITTMAGSNPSVGSWVNVDKPTGEWLGYASTNSSGVASIYTDNLSGPLTVHVDVPQRNDAIPSYVSTNKSFTASEVTVATSAGKFSATVALKQPNLRGIVRDPITKAAISNTWVEIRNESDNEWIPGASLTTSGTFGVYLKGSCCSATTKEYTITVNAPWDGTSKNVRKQYKALVNSSDVVTLYDKRSNALISSETLTGTSLFSMSLQEPNFKALVREPANGGTPGNVASWTYGQYGSISWAYADVYNPSTGDWIWNQRVESDGTLSMYLPGGCCRSSKEYELTLHPAWESGQSLVAKKYKVVVDYNDIPTVTDWRSGATVSTETRNSTTYQALTLGSPNVVGSVVNMYDTGTAYSWVTFNRQITNWAEAAAKGYKGCGQDCYFYSGIDGKFATNIEDGNYEVTAQQKWWGTFEGATSATCALKVETGTITSGNYCLQNDGKIKLKLRSPNLTMTLNDGTGPVKDAWVSIGIGNYWVGARSDDNGYVGIYIDTATVTSNNSGQSGVRKLRVYVDPPWSSTTMARWNCQSGDSKPICSALSDYTLGSAFSQTNLGTITPAKPNTTIRVTRPDTSGSAGWYNYVTVYRLNSGTEEWVGWGATNSDGIVSINIETTTANANSKYRVYVSPNWQLRESFTDKVYSNSDGAGYSWATLNSTSFALGTPNLQVTSLLPDAATPNKWGWAGVEYVNDSLTATSWYTSAGLNEYGIAAFTLPNSAKYRLTINPGPGRSGTSTTCYLQTDGSGVVSKIAGQCASGETTTATAMTFTLARGNVIGKIQAADGTGIAGAVIYANIDGAANEDAAVVSCSNSTGDYGLILKAGQTYKIKVFPVNKSGVTYLDNLSVPVLTVPGSGSTTLNITLST